MDLEVKACKGAKMVRGMEIVKTVINHRTLPKEKKEKLVEKVSEGIEVPVIELHVLETEDCVRRVSCGREDPPSRDSERECVWNDQPQRETTQSIVNRSEVSCDKDNVMRKRSFKMLGIWGQVIEDMKVLFNCPVPTKRIRTEDCESVEVIPVLSAKYKEGNRILTPLFTSSNDKLFLRDDNLINFVTCDEVLTTPVGRESMDNSLIKLSDIREENADVGLITSVKNKKHLIFNLFVIETYDAKQFAKNVELAKNNSRMSRLSCRWT